MKASQLLYWRWIVSSWTMMGALTVCLMISSVTAFSAGFHHTHVLPSTPVNRSGRTGASFVRVFSSRSLQMSSSISPEEANTVDEEIMAADDDGENENDALVLETDEDEEDTLVISNDDDEEDVIAMVDIDDENDNDNVVMEEDKDENNEDEDSEVDLVEDVIIESEVAEEILEDNEEPILASPEKSIGGETTPSQPTTPSPSPKAPSSSAVSKRREADPALELFQALAGATLKGSLDLLGSLRAAATIALASSLPAPEQEELLDRLGGASSSKSSSKSNDSGSAEMNRGSVQEEIILAVNEELKSKEEKWEQEKERLAREMEAAAEARVVNEIAIQQHRMEQERLAAQSQMQTSKSQLEAEIQALQDKLQEAQAVVLEKETQTEDFFKVKEDKLLQQMQAKDQQVQAMLAEKEAATKALLQFKESSQALQEETANLQSVQDLLEKRQEQQRQLAAVEADLRKKAAEIQRAKEELDQQQEQEQEEEQSGDAVRRLSSKEYRTLSEEEKGQLKAQRDAIRVERSESEDVPATSSDVHPVLGPVVKDLGYKRVHLVSSGKLGTIPIWKRQRIYRNNRAEAMAADKAKTMHLGFPGVVCLHEDKDGKLTILDGQHRIGMMRALREKRNKLVEEGKAEPDDLDESIFGNILVEVYPQPDNISDADKHAEQVFLEINKAEPVKLLDMPGVASDSDRAIITEAVTTLQSQYQKMFSPSQRCRIPNVNIDNLRSAIYGANVLKRNELTTSGKLVEWLIVQNASLGNKYETDEEKRSFVKQKAWEKASLNGFYLGLENSWLYQ